MTTAGGCVVDWACAAACKLLGSVALWSYDDLFLVLLFDEVLFALFCVVALLLDVVADAEAGAIGIRCAPFAGAAAIATGLAAIGIWDLIGLGVLLAWLMCCWWLLANEDGRIGVLLFAPFAVAVWW